MAIVFPPPSVAVSPRLFPTSLQVWIVALSALWGSLPTHAKPLKTLDLRLYVDYSAAPDPANLLAYNFCILDPASSAELGPGHSLGHTYLAYLSTVEAAPNTPLEASALARGIALDERNPDWNSRLLDVLHPEWASLMVEQQALAAAKLGYDGFFLDTVDSLSRLASLRPAQQAAQQEAMIAMIRRLKLQFPDKKIVINRGFDLLDRLAGTLDGVLIESVMHRRHPQTGDHEPLPPADRHWMDRQIRRSQALGLRVFAVDYVDPNDAKMARDTLTALKKLGCIPFLTTPELSGVVLGPVSERSREVLVLRGWNPALTHRANRPAENCWTARHLSPLLAPMGYHLRYLTPEHAAFAPASPQPHSTLPPALVIIDESLTLDTPGQAALLAQLQTFRRQEVPLLICGQPWTDPSLWLEAAALLGWKGSGQPTATQSPLRLSRFDGEWSADDHSPTDQTTRVYSLQAPPSSTPILSYQTPEGLPFDACFITEWGATWMETGSTLSRPRVSAQRVLAACLQTPASILPLPETASVSGRRVFFSTVQGEGFCRPSWLPGAPLCSEVLASELARHPHLPVTVAVAEADIRAWSAESDPAHMERYANIARSLYLLPHVEAASNSFSRPQNWSTDHLTLGPMRSIVPDRRASIERELAGSMSYLHRELLPPGKKVEVMLWPWGPPPSQAAIDLCHAYGVSQFPHAWNPGWNHSTPAIQRSSFQPQSADHSANSLAATWIQQHEDDPSQPARPIHLSYAIADLQQQRHIESLRTIQDWCLTQPLHPMPASAYARLLEDAARTRIFAAGPDRWIIVNQGHCRSLRLPSAVGVPDLQASSGITGYSRRSHEILIHLRGDACTELVMSRRPDLRQVRLAEANRLLDFYRIDRASAVFRVNGSEAAAVTLTGWPSGAACRITAAGAESHHNADHTGTLRFQAPAFATIQVSLRSDTPPYAASR